MAKWSLLFILMCSSLAAAEINVHTVYRRLTGKSLTPKHPLYSRLTVNNLQSAAEVIMTEDSDFIDLTSRDFATRMLHIDGDAYGPFSDMVATVMGVIRDDLDARELLTGDFLYAPAGRVSGGLKPQISNNTLYDRFSATEFSAKKYIQKFSPQWNSADAHSASGILTTRGWAKIYYDAGTNRRAVVGAFNAFTCQSIDEWKRRGLPDFRVRRDIDRAPEGKPSTFQNTCRTCHAAMDAFAGAFARLDYKNDSLVFSPIVVPKYNQNINIYPDGYITDDDSWLNLLNNTQGEGVKEFGEMIATSDDFKSCMVRRVVKQMCFKELKNTDEFVKKLVVDFEKSGFKFKELFKQAVVSEDCYL